MGYETDSYQLLPAGTVCASGALTTPPAANQFGGADFDRAVIRVAVSAISGATALAVCLQDSPDNGTTWYPTVQAAADMTGAPGYITLTPVAGKNFESTLTTFAGSYIRAVAWSTGGTTTCSITADFEKRIPDNS